MTHFVIHFARIIRVTPYRIQNALNQRAIVIVAGFQGVSEHREITSLGRGGSDTTAVALAAALNATYAEICSDVDGVYTSDPRSVPSAQHIGKLSYDEMQSMSDAGAKVLHAEAVEWARSKNIEIRCASTHAEGEKFTRIQEDKGAPRVAAVTCNVDVWCIDNRGCNIGVNPLRLVSLLGDWGIDGVRLMAQGHEWTLVFSVKNLHSESALRATLVEFGVSKVIANQALVTAVGRSLTSSSGAAADIQSVLEEKNIPILGLNIEPNGIGCLVSDVHAQLAVATLHETLIVGDIA